MSWEQGRDVIERLLAASELTGVVADLQIAGRLVEDAQRHLRSAATVADDDPNAGFAITYDAARKACSALLEAQGLRATSRGGHIAVRDAVVAQFGALHGALRRKLESHRVVRLVDRHNDQHILMLGHDHMERSYTNPAEDQSATVNVLLDGLTRAHNGLDIIGHQILFDQAASAPLEWSTISRPEYPVSTHTSPPVGPFSRS